MATLSRIVAWEIPRTEKPGGLPSMGSQESDTTERAHMHTRLPGEGLSPWVHPALRGPHCWAAQSPVLVAAPLLSVPEPQPSHFADPDDARTSESAHSSGLCISLLRVGLPCHVEKGRSQTSTFQGRLAFKDKP